MRMRVQPCKHWERKEWDEALQATVWQNYGRAADFPLPVKDHDGEYLQPAAPGYFLKESMAFGKPTLKHFFLEGTIPCRRDTMLKQMKSVRRKKQEWKWYGLTVTPHSPYPCSPGKGRQKGQGWKNEVYSGKKRIQGRNLALFSPCFSLSTCFHWQ